MLLLSLFLLGVVLSCPITGYVADNYGRKTACKILNIIFLIFPTLCILTCSNYYLFVITRFLSGFGYGGNSTLYNSHIGEFTKIQFRAK